MTLMIWQGIWKIWKKYEMHEELIWIILMTMTEWNKMTNTNEKIIIWQWMDNEQWKIVMTYDIYE